MSSIRIRHAEEADAGGIAAVYNHYIEHSVATFELDPVAGRTMRARIEAVQARGLPWLVATDATGALAGYAYAAPWRERAAYRHSVEASIYLARSRTGAGLGRRLYGALQQALDTLPVHAVIGGISLPNPASVALHEALGFTQVAHFQRVGYKFGRWIDVGYWQRFTPWCG